MTWTTMTLNKNREAVTWQDRQAMIEEFSGATLSKAKVKKQLRKEEKWQHFKNDLYRSIINETNSGGYTEVSITRHDQKAIHNWRHFQRIKNDLFGEEREAVELYPAESRLMDTANTYWLYILPEGMKVPFGFEDRHVTEDMACGSVQEAFED